MGKAKNKKAEERAKQKYLHVPQHIMEIRELSTAEKLLLAHIYSFGKKGCWQSNQTLGKLFDVAPRTIKRRLARIRKFVYVRSPRSRLRTFLAKSHPDVRKMAINEKPVRQVQQGQNCPPSTGPHLSGIRDKTGITTGPELALQQGQNCPTTNTYTRTETSKSTPASTPPAPWQGAASAPGPNDEDRKRFEEIHAGIIASRRPAASPEEFEKHKALALRRLRYPVNQRKDSEQPISQEEFEKRRATMKRQLRATELIERGPDRRNLPPADQPPSHAEHSASPHEPALSTSSDVPPGTQASP